MAAITEGRGVPERTGKSVTAGLAAATKILQGALVCLNAAGNMVNGTAALNLKAQGIAADEYDNTAGAAGDVIGTANKGIFRFANSSAGDLIAKADIGATAYIVDNQTVAKTDGTGTRSAAGKIFDVDAQGVWIDFR